MKKERIHSNQEIHSQSSGKLINLNSYFNGLHPSTNPYASIDDLLDETWNRETESGDPTVPLSTT